MTLAISPSTSSRRPGRRTAVHLTGDPWPAAAAHRHAHTACGLPEPEVDAAELFAAELATNAIVHARSPDAMRLTLHGHGRKLIAAVTLGCPLADEAHRAMPCRPADGLPPPVAGQAGPAGTGPRSRQTLTTVFPKLSPVNMP